MGFMQSSCFKTPVNQTNRLPIHLELLEEILGVVVDLCGIDLGLFAPTLMGDIDNQNMNCRKRRWVSIILELLSVEGDHFESQMSGKINRQEAGTFGSSKEGKYIVV